MIHFLPPSNPKMVAKVPTIAPTVDVLLANLEDGDPGERQGGGAGRTDRDRHGVGPRRHPALDAVNALDSPWVLDDLTAAVTEIGDRLDVIMIPKVEGPEDIHYADRLIAQLEARGRDQPADPPPRDPRDCPRRRQRRSDLRRVATGPGPQPRSRRPCRQPADEDDSGRRWPSRLRRAQPIPTPSHPTPRADRPAGSLALHARPDGRRLRHLRRASRTTARSATSPTPSPARTSSATPTCSAVSGRGACTRRRSTSPGECSARSRRRRPRRAGDRGDGRRHRSDHARRQDGGRRLGEAVPGGRRARRASSPPAIPSSPLPTPL